MMLCISAHTFIVFMFTVDVQQHTDVSDQEELSGSLTLHDSYFFLLYPDKPTTGSIYITSQLY